MRPEWAVSPKRAATVTAFLNGDHLFSYAVEALGLDGLAWTGFALPALLNQPLRMVTGVCIHLGDYRNKGVIHCALLLVAAARIMATTFDQ